MEILKRMKTRRYSELILLPDFESRFNYLKLDGEVGKETFGFDRYLNQVLYQSQEWRRTRDDVIVRDNACDLGIEGREILGYYDQDKNYRRPKIFIHHMIPITKEQILNRDPIVFNTEYLITCTLQTHNAIHYGNLEQIPKGPIERKPNDMCPWKQ